MTGRDEYNTLAQELQFTKTSAKLIKKETSDGFVTFLPGVPLGAEFIIYPGIVQTFKLRHHITGLVNYHTMVWADGHGSAGEGWVPVECIDWAGKTRVERYAQTIL